MMASLSRTQGWFAPEPSRTSGRSADDGGTATSYSRRDGYTCLDFPTTTPSPAATSLFGQLGEYCSELHNRNSNSLCSDWTQMTGCTDTIIGLPKARLSDEWNVQLGIHCTYLCKVKCQQTRLKLISQASNKLNTCAQNLSASMNPYVTALSRFNPCIRKGVPARLPAKTCHGIRCFESNQIQQQNVLNPTRSLHCLKLEVQVLSNLV